jgi:HlyD family secretion protein
MKKRNLMLGGLVLLVVLGGAFWYRSHVAAGLANAVVTEVEPPGVGALGYIEPRSRILNLTTPGGLNVTRIGRILVREGEQVQAGQILAELSDVGLKDAAVLQARAELAQVEATRAKVRAAGRPSEIDAQRARIRNLSAVEAINRRDAQRSETLVPSGAGAFATADRNRAQADAAAAAKAEAEALLETLSRPRPEDLALADAQVANAQAQVLRAEADAALSRIIAPIAGTIMRIYSRAGEQVAPEGVLEMANFDEMDAVADIYETDVPRLRIGATATVKLPGNGGHFQATVREIGWQVRRNVQANVDPIAATDARTLEVRLTLSEEGRRAVLRRSNMQVLVDIER